MTRPLNPLRHEPFIRKLEESQDEGVLEDVALAIPRLERVIAELMEYQERLAKLQYRARLIRDRHEPAAGRR